MPKCRRRGGEVLPDSQQFKSAVNEWKLLKAKDAQEVVLANKLMAVNRTVVWIGAHEGEK